MFENEKVYVSSVDEYVHVSRIIASWYNIVKRRKDRDVLGYESIYFAKWLNYIGLSDDDADTVYAIATNGKMELEHQAVDLINKLNKIFED